MVSINFSTSRLLFREIKCSLVVLFFCLASTATYGQTVDLALDASVDRVQPMTGIVFWTDNTSDLNTLGNNVQLEYSYLVYADVVSQKDVYNWSVVDNLLATAASRGRQVILRFRYTYPGVTTPSVPQYIRNRSDYSDNYENVEGSNTYIPDWSNQELQNFTLEFFTKFAQRYDHDARLAFVQVGFGSYSEYHLYSGPLRFGDTFPAKAYQTTFLQHVDNVFQETQWSISIDAASSDYTPIAASSTLRNLGYGLFDDSFLHETHSTSDSEYNRASWLTFGANRANTQAAGGELNYYSDWDQQNVLNVGGPYGFTFEEMSEMYDITYMIGNDQLNYQSAARIKNAAMATGYHFQVTAYKTVNGSQTLVTIKNNGIAPIYYDAYPTVGNTRSNTSLKGLLSGASRTFSINAVPNSTGLTIASDRLVSGQEIQFDANLAGGTVNSGNPIVTLSKSNATGFGIDGNRGGANRQNIYLWRYNSNNVNQQWEEIDRGNGYYSYKKVHTNYCIDGNNGGGNRQNVYLWSCNDTNQNQHWKKISNANGTYRLEKRNASGYSLDGNNGGDNLQNIYLWPSNTNNANQQWIITTIGTSDKRLVTDFKEDYGVISGLNIYTTPDRNLLNITFDNYQDFRELKVVDITGKTMITESLISNDVVTLDTSMLSMGVYILQAYKVDGGKISQLFSK